MKYDSLRDFINLLESKGELIRISEKVDRDLEITEITDRVSKSDNNKALLFENVDGFETPILMNAFGSFNRMAWALSVDDIESIATEIRDLLVPELPEGFLEKLKMLPKLAQAAQYPPKMVKSGPCQEIEIEPNLDLIPVIKCWPQDGGRFITLPMVITKDPESKVRNMGMYRMQVYGKTTTGMHWHIHKGGASHFRDYQRLGIDRMEVAVAIGADPATIYSATAPLPDGIDEFLLAGFIRKRPVELVKCRTIDIEVPAHAEYILEGYIDINELKREGPFGDHTGYYSLADDYPVFHVTHMTHRKNPIYPSTIVGKPPMEDCYMGKATERIFLPLIKLQLPEIVDFNLPLEGVFHNLAFVSIRKSYPGQARKVANAMWGLGQMMFTKIIIVVDDDVDVQSTSEVLWRLGNNVSPERDTMIVKGPLDA
ncbi:menaquinone biosynthesis decarboxylase, partial [bacterium]|nr:menaquinone biosynthesis decarboxylase [bacterium]MBU1025376.1 menaquinone biosynthesis decarboxylase [bacterium]